MKSRAFHCRIKCNIYFTFLDLHESAPWLEILPYIFPEKSQLIHSGPLALKGGFEKSFEELAQMKHVAFYIRQIP